MKKLLLSLLLVCTVAIASSQNYWQAYPLVAQVTSNGGQQRLEVSVYDSLLQSWVYYNTPYYNESISFVNNYGIITFNTYHPPSTSNIDSIFGYIIYDYEIFQFATVINAFSDPLTPGANIYSGMLAVNYETETLDLNGDQVYTDYYARYDLKQHTWKVLSTYYGNSSCIGTTNMTGASYAFDCNDYDGELFIYDPATHGYGITSSGCFSIFINVEDDYVLEDIDCGSTDGYLVYDPSIHTWQSFARWFFLNNTYSNGIFYYSPLSGGSGGYFGAYDEMLNQWMIDSTDQPISNVQIKDRVVAYMDVSTIPERVYFQVYSPTLHSWVKDSADAIGLTGILLVNGTILWTDGSGLHFRGYNDTTGWGNYNTPLFLNFYLTDLSSPTEGNLIHVRNYSIGTDSVKYDFGDGITSIGNTRVLWHLYKTAGPFNVCITNYSGTQSSCQTVSFVTGIKESEEINPDLFVYYRSSEQTAFISAQKLKGKNYVLHIYDLLGKELFKEDGKLNSEDFTKGLNCATFAKGMYLVSLQTEKDRLIKRFIKE